MELALFDFDGTVTSKDSFGDFLLFCVGKRKFYWGMLKMSPVLIAYILGFVPNYKAKQALVKYFFKGWATDQFEECSRKYSEKKLPKIIKRTALERIRWHKKQGHDIAIVTASFESYLKSWTDEYEITLIATQLEMTAQKLTGQFATPNCYGSEKIRRVKERYNLDHYNVIYAYGDSKGDLELLALADKSYYRYFS